MSGDIYDAIRLAKQGDREAAERLVCPNCGGRAHHTVGGKEFCSLCLEEMRRE